MTLRHSRVPLAKFLEASFVFQIRHGQSKRPARSNFILNPCLEVMRFGCSVGAWLPDFWLCCSPFYIVYQSGSSMAESSTSFGALELACLEVCLFCGPRRIIAMKASSSSSKKLIGASNGWPIDHLQNLACLRNLFSPRPTGTTLAPAHLVKAFSYHQELREMEREAFWPGNQPQAWMWTVARH